MTPISHLSIGVVHGTLHRTSLLVTVLPCSTLLISPIGKICHSSLRCIFLRHILGVLAQCRFASKASTRLPFQAILLTASTMWQELMHGYSMEMTQILELGDVPCIAL